MYQDRYNKRKAELLTNKNISPKNRATVIKKNNFDFLRKDNIDPLTKNIK